MSEPIKWQELTPEQRNALVAEKVMGWQEKPCDGEWDELSGGWFCTKCGYGANWDDGFAHTEVPPRYTQSMDAAQKVLLYTAFNSRPGISDLAVLVREVFMMQPGEIYDIDPFYTLGIVNAWTPEFLCIACLRACGYEVIHER